jgi:D-alanyl-lipoteichoic acid acyltransferase DltB (MBOAT superfamily)
MFVFMPVTLLAFFLAARVSRTLALFFLLLASLVFYSGWSGFPWLVICSFTFNYLVARTLIWSHTNAAPAVPRLVLGGGIAVNLALLFYFKYTNFAVMSILPHVGIVLPSPGIVLPIGISFFTFTQIAFLVDIARREVTETDFLKFGLFVTYFPHLLAGPIIHHKEVMPQFGKNSTYLPSVENFSIGLTIFTIGLFKKVVLADTYIPAASQLFAGDHVPLLFESWRGALAYSLQIYFDFSGYSDMAIGLSRLFGIDLPINFNSPYKAVSIIDFWRRWHMTLSRFLRDYLYIPLGGNRRGEGRRYVNLFLTMLLGGIWHGAGWTYVIWGALHGTYLVINHLCHSAGLRLRGHAPRLAGWALTFLAVVVGWVFFRAPNVATALMILKGMAGLNNSGGLHALLHEEISITGFAAIGMGIAIALFLPNSQQLMQKFHPGLLPQEMRGDSGYHGWLVVQRLTLALGILAGLVFFVALSRMSHVTEFIYYQF